MKRLAATGLIGALLLAGCASQPATQVELDKSYVLEWIGERPLIDRSRLTMNLGRDGRAYGNAGCNHWFATYTLQGQTLTFDKVGKTRKLCVESLMEQEQRFLTALPGTRRWDISPIQQLRLWPAEGQPLRFWPE